MEQLKIFEYNNHDVRTIIKGDEPYFCLKDVCKVLCIENHKDIPTRLDDDEVGRFDAPHPQSPNKTIQMLFVSESGLYSVILRSDKPGAKKFRRFITKEVMPSIRKHGAYITPSKIDELIDNPDLIIKLATDLKNERQAKKKLLAENSVMKPKAEYFDELVDRNLLTNFRDTAKALKIKETDFIQFLLEEKYIYRNSKGKLLPYAEQNNNLFEIKETMNQKTNWTGVQTLITPKGRETFRLLLKQDSCMEIEYENSQNDDDFEG